VGTTVGSYRLLSVLGSGGMGTVYLAEHVRIGRQVALKLLRPEVRDRPEVAQRLRAEARALGRVSHPGVVGILDLDSLSDGTTYLVMEYLPGRSLREELRLAKQSPPLATTLSMLHQAARAMAAAHAAGVIHRDLSPANIMVLKSADGAAPELKILDFGLARLFSPDGASDSSMSRTRDGAVLGTLKYMAPEQCLDPHSVDERADVYSLGVIGYELLAGQPPFSASSSWELITLHLREAPPPLPERVAGSDTPLPPALAALILEMLAKSPLGRPEMAEVAARLGALAPAGVAVAPAGVQPPLRVLRRRLARARLGTGIALAALLAGAISAGLYARQQRRIAEQRRQESLAAVGEVLDVVNRSLRPIPGANNASQALLDTAAHVLGGLNAQEPSDLEALEALTRVHTLRGELARNHGGLATARKEFERAIVLCEALVSKRPKSIAYRARLASAYDGLADALEQMSELPLAKATYERALALRLELRQLTPEDPVRIQEVVGSYLQRGDLQRSQGLHRKALDDYEKAQALLEPLWKREPDKKSYRWQMCGVLYRSSEQLLTVGRSADSLTAAERAVDLLMRISPTDQQGTSYHLLLSRVLQTRGSARERLGRLGDAGHDYNQAFDIVRALLKASPSDVQCRRALIDSGYKMIDHWLRVGKVDAAAPIAAELQTVAEALQQADSAHQGHRWRLAGSLQRVGDVALARAHADEARSIYHRALELQESLRAQTPDHSRHRERTIWMLERQGDAVSQGAFPEQALLPWAQALALLAKLERVDPAAVDVRLALARIHRKRAALRPRLGQKDEAMADWARAAAMADAVLAGDPANGEAERELILTELGRAAALGKALALQPALVERVTRARTLLRTLRQQGLYAGDIELMAAEQTPLL